MCRRFVEIVEALSRACGFLAGLLLTVSMVVVCQMILMRYLFRAPTIWQTDAVVFSATAAIFMGAPYVLLKKAHVGVDVVQLLFSPRNRLRLARLGAVFGLLFCLIMTVATAIYFFEAVDGGWTTASIAKVPLWMPVGPMLLGFALLSLQYVAELIKLQGDPA